MPYTYLIKHVPTNTFYYGVRYAKNCTPSELWNTYFTSSTYIHELVQRYGLDSFNVEIRRTFSNSLKARLWETKVLKRLKAATRSDFINKTDNISIDPACASKSMKGRCGTRHPAYGRHRPDVSARNALQTGEHNPMFGKTGSMAPCYGRSGKKHPMFGKSNPGASLNCKQQVTCPHCGKTGKRSGMQRWHFNYCKLKGE